MQSVVFYLIKACQQVLEQCFFLLENFDQSEWMFADVAALSIVKFIIGTFLLIFLYLRYWFVAIPCLGLIAMVYVYDYQKKQTVVFTILDVGQGSAAILHQGERAVIFDVGDAFSSGFTMWKNVLHPYLKSQEVKYVEAVYISHNDRDHAGGLRDLLTIFPHTTLYTPFSQLEYLSAYDSHDCSTIQAPKDVFGATTDIDLAITILWPRFDVATNMAQADKNNSSCVLSISIGEDKILLPGDIEKEAESRLLGLYSGEF